MPLLKAILSTQIFILLLVGCSTPSADGIYNFQSQEISISVRDSDKFVYMYSFLEPFDSAISTEIVLLNSRFIVFDITGPLYAIDNNFNCNTDTKMKTDTVLIDNVERKLVSITLKHLDSQLGECFIYSFLQADGPDGLADSLFNVSLIDKNGNLLGFMNHRKVDNFSDIIVNELFYISSGEVPLGSLKLRAVTR